MKNKDIRVSVRFSEDDHNELEKLYHVMNKSRCIALNIEPIEENYSMKKSDVVRYAVKFAYSENNIADYEI